MAGLQPNHPPPPYSTLAEHSHNRDPSSTASPNAHEGADVTWLDFLRTAGGTVRDSPARDGHQGRLGDRTFVSTRDTSLPSRYNTAMSRSSIPENESRVQFATPHNGSATLPLRQHPLRSRRQTVDSELPRWQPDADVSKCPVCDTEFTFWYRKHHCRKCGRVVCSACSPHRITIPQQYVVQPPGLVDNRWEEEDTPSSLTCNLGGGEIVRVCNPCVPDPWTPRAADPAGRLEPDAQGPHDRDAREPDGAEYAGAGDRPVHTAVPVPPPFRQPADRYRYHANLGRDAGRSRSQSQQHTATFSRSVPHSGEASTTSANPGQQVSMPALASASQRRHRHTASTNSYLTRSMDPMRLAQPDMLPTPLPPPSSRRLVREEDECPVCGMELPPGDAIRERHVEECIVSRFSTSQPATPPANVSSQTPPNSAQPARLRTTSFRSRGMAVYRATEKDCATESGETQECIICFEDFRPGDEMGRMECLCKFHRACIRRWWSTKGPGSCPTHQLQE